MDKDRRVEYNIVGTGIAFWPERGMSVDGQGNLAVMSGEQDIVKSIYIILGTAPGERVMRPDFGCGVHDLVFASPGPQTFGLVSYHVERALARWEPRIEVTEVVTTTDPLNQERLLIDISYRVVPTNSDRNLVYPFYVIPRGQE